LDFADVYVQPRLNIIDAQQFEGVLSY